MAEHRAYIAEVIGSNPFPPTRARLSEMPKNQFLCIYMTPFEIILSKVFEKPIHSTQSQSGGVSEAIGFFFKIF